MAQRTLSVEKAAYTGLYRNGDRARSGGDQHLAVGWSAGSYQVVGHLQFELDWTDVARITKGTLRLTSTTDHAGWPFAGGPVCHVVMTTSYWTDNEAAGEGEFPKGSWGYPTYDDRFAVNGTPVPDAGQTFDLDITKLMDGWAPKTVKTAAGQPGWALPNFGVHISTPGSYTAERRFQVASDKHPTTAWRPKLILEYAAVGGPGIVVLTAPASVISQVEGIYFEGDHLQGRPDDQIVSHEIEYYTKKADATWSDPTTISGGATASEQETAHFSVPLPGSLKSQIDYEWRARVLTSGGDRTPWTGRRALRITTNNPVLTNPVPKTGTPPGGTLQGVKFGADYSDPDNNPLASFRIQVRTQTAPTDPDWDAVPMLWDTSDRQPTAGLYGLLPGVPGVPVIKGQIRLLYEGQALAPGTYSWRIKATDSLGADSPWIYRDFTLTVGYEPSPGTIDYMTGYARRKTRARILIRAMGTNRGPGKTVAILEDAAHIGATEFYNNPGEFFFTIPAVHPQVGVIEPFQVHYALEMYSGEGWQEKSAGLITDFDATDDEVVFYGMDYLGLLSLNYDERYQADRSAETSTEEGGSKYSSKTIRQIIVDQLTLAKAVPADDSPVGFISLGQIDQLDYGTTAPKLNIFATFKQRLEFIAGLIESYKAGTGRRTRILVRRTIDGAYFWDVRDNPGKDRDNIRFEYGGLAQGFRVVPFGDFATRLYAIGRVTDQLKPYYAKHNAPGINEDVYGRLPRVNVWPDLVDANDLKRRAKQMAAGIGKVGKRVAIAIRVDALAVKDGWDVCDSVLVDLRRGVVNTYAMGSGYWTIWGWAWHLYPDGHDELTLSLLPRQDTSPPDADLIPEDPIHDTIPEWQLPFHPPDPCVPTGQINPGTYTTNRGTPSGPMGPTFVLPNKAGNLSYRFKGSDIHGFNGYPAGGTGGTHMIRLVNTGAAQPQAYDFPIVPGNPATNVPFDYSGTITNGGALTTLKDGTPRYFFLFNGDNRESWSITIEYGELWYTADGPADCEDPDAPQPVPGQEVQGDQVGVGDGTTTQFTTHWPYQPGSLRVAVDSVPIIAGLTELNPAAGTFSLDFAPLGPIGDSRAEAVVATYVYWV